MIFNCFLSYRPRPLTASPFVHKLFEFLYSKMNTALPDNLMINPCQCQNMSMESSSPVDRHRPLEGFLGRVLDLRPL